MSSFVKPAGATRAQVDELVSILSIMRPHGSKMEQHFINEFLAPLKPDVDKQGNLMVRIGKAPVMWSCHIDTVHRYGGIAPIEVDPMGIIKVPDYSKANCLGADDGAGVWLMLQMIRAERPGLYIFHRGEECGGIGSKFIAKNTPEVVKGIECAIAFDRKSTGSIITHQWGGRCCSEVFSESLSKAIGLGMKSDETGSFTDTASYVDLIGECTNVSVGYTAQHSRSEEQDMVFLIDLCERMLELDVRDLSYKRKPGDKEARRYGNNNWASYVNDPQFKWEKGKEWDAFLMGWVYKDKVWDETKKKWVKPEPMEKNARSYMDTRTDVKVYRKVTTGSTTVTTIEGYLRIVKDFPEEIAALLEEKKYGLGYLHEQIRKYGGKVETVYYNNNNTSDRVCGGCARLKRYCCCH